MLSCRIWKRRVWGVLIIGWLFISVDDIVMAAHSDQIDLFETFNDYHDRIKFTIKYEKDALLAFQICF